MSDIAALHEAEKAETMARKEEQAMLAKSRAMRETEPERWKRLGYEVKTGLTKDEMRDLCEGPEAEYLIFDQYEDRSTPRYQMVYAVRSIEQVHLPVIAGKGNGKGKPKGRVKAKDADGQAALSTELQTDADIE